MVKRLVILHLAFFLWVLFHAQAGLTQSSEDLEALKKEVEALKEGQKAIQKELEAIKNLFRGRQSLQQEYQHVALNIDDKPFKGDKNAPLTLVEFSDYQCPFCARHFTEVFPQIESDYIKTGKIKYVFRDFPIETIHLQAFKSAEAASCAGDQGKYWEMHGWLFANQEALSLQSIFQYVRTMGLDLANFEKCLTTGKQAVKIRKDIAEGERAGIRGTPTFFVGRTQPNDSNIKALRVIRGAQSFNSFKEVLDSLLDISN